MITTRAKGLRIIWHFDGDVHILKGNVLIAAIWDNGSLRHYRPDLILTADQKRLLVDLQFLKQNRNR